MFSEVVPWIPQVFSMFFLRSCCCFLWIGQSRDSHIGPIVSNDSIVRHMLFTCCVRGPVWLASMVRERVASLNIRCLFISLASECNGNNPRKKWTPQLSVIGWFMPTTRWPTHPPRQLLLAVWEFIYPPWRLAIGRAGAQAGLWNQPAISNIATLRIVTAPLLIVPIDLRTVAKPNRSWWTGTQALSRRWSILVDGSCWF